MRNLFKIGVQWDILYVGRNRFGQVVQRGSIGNPYPNHPNHPNNPNRLKTRTLILLRVCVKKKSDVDPKRGGREGMGNYSAIL